MMDEFLRGFGGQYSEVEKQWIKEVEEKKMIAVNVSEELKELLKVYMDAEKHLEQRERQETENLVYTMEKFIKVYKERQKVSTKLYALKKKMQLKEDVSEEVKEEGEEE
jgi:hypothetical protein